MKKKMTHKEFKEALSIGGLDLSVFGYEGILNELIIATRSSMENMDRMGFFAAARRCEQNADKLEQLLTDRGYYEY